MNPELTKIIAQYLAGELSEIDRLHFEESLKTNETFRLELELQKSVMEAAKRSAIRTEVGNIAKSFHFNQTIKWTGITFGLAVLATALTMLIYQYVSKDDAKGIEDLTELIDEVKKNSLINDLPSEFFAWNGKDTALLTKGGVLISIPETAFLLNGKPYTKNALIQFQEALDAATIVKSGLSTMADDRLLETQGMFTFTALTEDGKQLTINPKTGVYIQVPVDEYKKDMQLFTGETGKDGIINWVNPKPLAKIPVPVDMNKLNFYPPGYEDSLNQMKLRKDKKYRDSLYLSCEENRGVYDYNSGSKLFSAKCASCHHPNKNSTGPKLYKVRKKWTDEGAKAGSIYDWVKNWQSAAKKDPYAQRISMLTPIAHSDHPELSIEQIDQIFDFIDGSVLPTKAFQFDISSEKLTYPEIMNGNWKGHVKWNYSIKYLPNNEALIMGKASFLDQSDSQTWGFVEITQDFIRKDYVKKGIGLQYKKSKEIKFVFDESNNFYSIGDVEYKIKSNLVYSDNLKWSTKDDIICTQKIKILNGQSFNIKFQNHFQIMTESPPCLIKQDILLLNVNGVNINKEGSSMYEISPSSVLAFWKPKFNNTILATREFEKRMQAIHGTCNNKVLEVYTKNLNKSISELDQRVVKMGYSNFNAFAAENVGTLNPTNPHIKTLNEFYERTVSELQEEVKRNRIKEQKRNDKWDAEVQKERTKESNRTVQRNTKNYHEEYDLNYESALKQLGRKKPQLGNTVGVTITGTGIYNLDRYVAEVTTARKTGEFFDKKTGKTARIQYNDFSVEVENAGSYEKLFVYLFPSELTSFQRISGTNGKFNYPLNDGIIYDVAIVGISEKGYSYYQHSKIKGGKLGKVNLEHVGEEKLNASIEQLNRNRISKPMRITDELSWLKTEQKNYVEQKNRQNQALFEERIKRIVFPCRGELPFAPTEKTIEATDNKNRIPF